MVTHELLVRTMNAAKEARKQGFEGTADALDEIVENLLQLFNPGTQLEHEIQTHSHSESISIN